MTQAVINGNTYSDDGTSAKDMLHGGHRTWFLPMVGDVATVAGVVATNAAQAAIDASTSSAGAAALKGTSTTSLTVAAGSQSLATQSGKNFTAGNYVTISRTSSPSTMMHGIVTSYSGTALVVNVAIFAGSGTYTDWTIAISGPQGATGATGTAGDIAYLAKSGAYTVTSADKAKLIDCTSGTFTLAFQACATLGAGWTTHIRNSGSGIITIDPNSAETIDGFDTIAVNPGVSIQVNCNGTSLRTIGSSVYGRTQSIHVRDEKASGTDAGTSVVGWQFRQLNTVVSNTISGASLSSDTVSLPAGSYHFHAIATAAGSGVNSTQRLALYNTTDSVTILQGVNAGIRESGTPTSVVSGMFSITAAKSLRLRQYIAGAGTGQGLGMALSTGEAEVFSDLQIWRIA